MEVSDRAVRDLVLESFGAILVCEENSGHGNADPEAAIQ